MSVARISEISARSPKSFEAAVEEGIERASETLEGIEGAWIKEQKVVIEDGQVSEYEVILKVSFVLKD